MEIVGACVYTPGQMQAFKICKVCNYYQSGFLHTIFYHPVSNFSKCCILKDKLAYAQMHSDTPVNASISGNKDDCQIKAAHCTYMAGIGEACSHIAAMLFKMEASIGEYISKQHLLKLPISRIMLTKNYVKPLCELS